MVAQLVKNQPAMWETWVRSLGWEDPLEKGTATHSILNSRLLSLITSPSTFNSLMLISLLRNNSLTSSIPPIHSTILFSLSNTFLFFHFPKSWLNPAISLLSFTLVQLKPAREKPHNSAHGLYFKLTTQNSNGHSTLLRSFTYISLVNLIPSLKITILQCFFFLSCTSPNSLMSYFTEKIEVIRQGGFHVLTIKVTTVKEAPLLPSKYLLLVF